MAKLYENTVILTQPHYLVLHISTHVHVQDPTRENLNECPEVDEIFPILVARLLSISPPEIVIVLHVNKDEILALGKGRNVHLGVVRSKDVVLVAEMVAVPCLQDVIHMIVVGIAVVVGSEHRIRQSRI